MGGGLDDRFDFQLPSSALIDGAGLTYIAGTYRSLGNDGLHYNTSINDGSNFYFPDDLARSNALADALFEASDHLPVIAEYQIPAVLSGSLPADFDRVIQGASVQLELEIRNAAPVEFALGAEPLDFTAIGDGNLVGSCSGTLLPLDAPTVCSFDLFTASVGVASGSVVAFTGMQQGVQNEVLVLETTGTVLRPAAPSFDPERLQIAQAVMVSFESNSGLQSIPVAIHNLGFDALQALLDVDAVTGLAAPLALAGPLPTDIGNDAALIELRFDTAGLSPGIYPTVLDIEVSDEDLPGEQTSSLVLDVTVEIVGAADCPADLNHDGTIDVLDLVQLIVAWGACPAPCAADVTGDGAVDVLDLVQVILGWGPCG